MNFEKLLSEATGKTLTVDDINGKKVLIRTQDFIIEGFVDMPEIYDFSKTDEDKLIFHKHKYSIVVLKNTIIHTQVQDYTYKHISINDEFIQSVQLL